MKLKTKNAPKPAAPLRRPGRPTPVSPAGPRCKVCRDPRLNAITTDLAAGMSQNGVAKKYGFTTPVVWKHVHQHMGAALLQHNLSAPVLEQIRNLNYRTLRILGDAEYGRWKDPEVALKAIAQARHNLELIAKLTGELKLPAANEPVQVQVVYVDAAPRGSEPPPAIDASAGGV